jgi:hypothetical protein
MTIRGGRHITPCQPGPVTAAKLPFSTGTMTAYSTLDYNGYPRNGPGRFIEWYDRQIQASYESLAEFAAEAGHEKHGAMVAYDGFVRAAPPERGKTTEPDQWDLRLRPGAAAVDRGCVLAAVNDGFADAAPDLGCYERAKIRLPTARDRPRTPVAEFVRIRMETVAAFRFGRKIPVCALPS